MKNKLAMLALDFGVYSLSIAMTMLGLFVASDRVRYMIENGLPYTFKEYLVTATTIIAVVYVYKAVAMLVNVAGEAKNDK
ncbi:hypothetical protein [Weissella ceti]|uniref:Uncharacterized protein n=1 Tax=Weissella ceti TaxID=759620 RepID=A0A088GMF7_9LACO|nr:hypothetical protein [Weissella ceti]AIM63089.1 hypothetical protein WS74_0837 [Weissella ceti]